MLSSVLWLVVALFPVSESALAIFKRADASSARSEDHGSLRLLWVVITLSVLAAITCMWIPWARLPVPRQLVQAAALACLIAGFAVRWMAIVTLGRLFTVNVAIQADHALIQGGLYRHVRHPSYTGLLLAFLGLGLAYGNWLSLAVLMVPITAAVIHRIGHEEKALHAALGPAYADYCARVKRLVPGLF